MTDPQPPASADKLCFFCGAVDWRDATTWHAVDCIAGSDTVGFAPPLADADELAVAQGAALLAEGRPVRFLGRRDAHGRVVSVSVEVVEHV